MPHIETLCSEFMQSRDKGNNSSDESIIEIIVNLHISLGYTDLKKPFAKKM